MTAGRSIERLSLYRRLLQGCLAQGRRHIFSHQLAALASGTGAQVRRDIMAIGYSGSPNYGYDVARLIGAIGEVLDTPEGDNVVLLGVGNLGRALLAYFSGRHPRLRVVGAFDVDPNRVGRVIHGCRCYPVEELGAVVRRENVVVGILAVPATEAQKAVDRMYEAGIRGVLNFAPMPLAVPKDMFVERMDVTTALEKVAYFARQQVGTS